MLIHILTIQYFDEEPDVYLCQNLEIVTKIIREYFGNEFMKYSKIVNRDCFELTEFEMHLWDNGIGHWTIHSQRLLD